MIRLILVAMVFALGCDPSCPPSQVDATFCYAAHSPQDRVGLKFDHNGDGVVALDDVSIAEQAFAECREP